MSSSGRGNQDWKLFWSLEHLDEGSLLAFICFWFTRRLIVGMFFPRPYTLFQLFSCQSI
jgi:hypothetical protein